MDRSHLLSWVELSRSHLYHNIASLARLASDSQLAVSVKANAYGHGLAEMVTLLIDNPKVAYLTVHSLEEAQVCRQSGWTRSIILLGPAPINRLDEVFELEIEPVVFTLPALKRLSKLAAKRKQPVKTHLKLETGTHRQGIDESELPAFAEIYKSSEYLKRPFGASMHFANIEDTTNHDYALGQLKRYNETIKSMTKLGIKPKVRHTACSAAAILFRETRFELVRPGISVYGYWPSKETYLSYFMSGGSNDLFKPVLSWKTRVTQIKDLPAEAYIGYGCTYRTTAPAKIAVLPIGYADGFSRSLSSVAYVLIKGRRAPVRGRVCMNLLMVDITDIPGVKLEDEVILLGSAGSPGETGRDTQPHDIERITADLWGQWGNTISYEVLARLSPNLPRIIID